MPQRGDQDVVRLTDRGARCKLLKLAVIESQFIVALDVQIDIDSVDRNLRLSKPLILDEFLMFTCRRASHERNCGINVMSRLWW